MPARLLTPIPLHRVATAMPFINYLHQTGAPVERELMRANLPVQAMEDPDCFIPSRNYWTFIANVVKRKGMEDLGFRVGQQVGANAADPGLAKRLTRLATLHRALDKFCKIASAEITQVDLWLGPADKNTHQLHYRTSYDREHPACVQFQWYGLMAAVAAIQLFAGKHWKPRQIGLATDEIPGNAIRAYFPNTRFLQGQSHCFIAMDNRLLGKPPLPHEDILQSLPRYSKIKPPRDFMWRPAMNQPSIFSRIPNTPSPKAPPCSASPTSRTSPAPFDAGPVSVHASISSKKGGRYISDLILRHSPIFNSASGTQNGHLFILEYPQCPTRRILPHNPEMYALQATDTGRIR
jgi:hypothetical protein